MSEQEYPQDKITVDPLPHPFRDNQYIVYCKAQETDGLTVDDCLLVQMSNFRQNNMTIRSTFLPEDGKRCNFDLLVGIDTGVSQCGNYGLLYTNPHVSPQEFAKYQSDR
jgi:hypothetical protein